MDSRVPPGPNFQETMQALLSNFSTATIPTPKKEISIRNLVELKILDFRKSFHYDVTIGAC